MAKQRSGGLVGWAVVQHERETDILKDCLKSSASLQILQVEELTPEFRALMKNNRRRQNSEPGH